MHFSSQDVLAFLDHNDIADIDVHTFSGQLPILLDVSYNALTALDQGVFQVRNVVLAGEGSNEGVKDK